MNAATRRVEGRVAIITGGASGQGAREARRFVAEGAKVVVTDVNTAGGQALAAELGANAMFVKHDVTQEQEWEAVVKATVAKFGKLNVLVNNAGVYKPGPLIDTTQENFDLHYRVNMLSCFLGMKHAITPMKNAGGGSIVNISSGAGMRGYPDMIGYLGTKWAIRGMTKGAARELAQFNIRVNSVHPGLVDTPMLGDHKPEALKAFADAVPMKRIGTTDDVAEIVIYLASELSSYVTGAELVVDGGIGL
jgi:3alpha(or 20beta)-hydroxysteroid dehydrogenase